MSFAACSAQSLVRGNLRDRARNVVATQKLRFMQPPIVGVVHKQRRPTLDLPNKPIVYRRSDGRASPAPPEASMKGDERLTDVGSPMHHDGTPDGAVVETRLKADEPQGETVAAMIHVTGPKQPEARLQRAESVREGKGEVFSGIPAMSNELVEQNPLA